MRIRLLLGSFKHGRTIRPIYKQTVGRYYHDLPFIEFYTKTTGEVMTSDYLHKLKKHHPNLDTLSKDSLQCTLQILDKFGITALEACQNIHVFSMNPITLDNYGEILRECGFTKIIPDYIVKYHTIIRRRTIAWLKKEGLLKSDNNLEEVLKNQFKKWPVNQKSLSVPDCNTNILTIRMHVLQNYLQWRLTVTEHEFIKFCRNYLPLRHKPMSDIEEAIDLAQHDIQFKDATIRKNGFIISADPINTRLILEKVDFVAGLDIRSVIKIEPAILKNNYRSILKIRNILEEYRIPEEAQRKCLKVYCMRPTSVKERLEELTSLKEYNILKTNPRVLSMVVHKKKMMERLEKIYMLKKQCYSLNHLVSSSKVFNSYISNFGSKVCGRDLATLITSSLQLNNLNNGNMNENEIMNIILMKFKRHKYWLHTTLNVISENIQYLKKKFDDKVIFNNCQILLYPKTELDIYIKYLLSMRAGDMTAAQDLQLEGNYNVLEYSQLDDDQILSLVLYEIEKKYHFSGDGIWADVNKAESLYS